MIYKFKILGIFFLLFFFGLLSACEDQKNNCEDPHNTGSVDSDLYTVRFEANGGTPEPINQSVIKGGKVTEPRDMSKIGYNFIGWFKEQDCINIWNFETDIVNNDITIYAKWLSNDINNFVYVFFNPNGGYLNNQYQYYSIGDLIIEPSIFRNGYTFIDWYKEETFINKWNFNVDIITSNITLYAKWEKIYYTVTFLADNGSPAPEQQIVAYGDKIIEPPVMTKIGYNFKGWYANSEFSYIWNFDQNIVYNNIILYAKWNTPIVIEGANYNAKIRWLDTNVQSGNDYILEFDSDQSIDSTVFSFSSKSNISITIKGIETIRTINQNTASAIFTIGSGVTLVLDKNLELQGRSSGSNPLIVINSGGRLIINENIKITGNNNSSTSSLGGGILVNSNGIFIMNGGEISGNTSRSNGGGVYVNGTFIINNGKIIGNNTSNFSNGGGVYISSFANFTMNDGEISDNSSYRGGGIYLQGGNFTMNGGIISNNNSGLTGGGIYVGGIFIMNDGIIKGNNASSWSSYGGGVYVDGTAFNKNGGIIYGFLDENINSNVVSNGSGLVQQNRGHAVHIAHSNSFYNMGRDSTIEPFEIISFNGTTNPPVSIGDWDY